MPVKLLATPRDFWKGATIYNQEILSICCELQLDRQYERNTY
jgi:hypothetical protein